MNALDSPLEALALNYLSFGFLTAVNNLWAWVAVITTAAFSVWRIRASSPRGKSLDGSSLLTCFSSPPSSSTVVERVADKPVPTSTAAEASIPSTSSASVFQREGRTSGKFTVYYQDEDCKHDDGNIDCSDDVDVLGGGDGEGDEWLGNGWEVMMKMRMGDMGWYRYQDLTVLDGNVVRLWDGCRRRNAATLTSCGDGKSVFTW